MKKQLITLTGRILSLQSKTGLPNLRIEAWDKDMLVDDFAGSAVTDSNGRFSITLKQMPGGWNLTDRKPDIYFKVYAGDRLLHNTMDSVLWNLDKNKNDIEILIDMEHIMANQIETRKANIVLGRVLDKQNHPLANLFVRVYDRDMRSEVLLAETVTSKEGKYEITWLQSQLTGRNKKEADISIKILTPEKKTLLFTSDINSVRFNASSREEINIIIQSEVKPELVEYDYILKEVTFLANRVAITDLQENKEHQDITFLSREEEIPSEKIEYLIVAHRLQKLSKIDAAFFYALLRENTLLKIDSTKLFNARLSIGINTEIKYLLYDAALADPKTIQDDVKKAVKEMIVDTKVSKECKQSIELLQQYKERASAYYESEQPKKVLDAIAGFISGDKIQEIGKLFEANKNDLNTFFEKITDPSFFITEAKATDAKINIALGQLLGFGSEIIPQVIESKKITRPEDVKKLAKLNKAGWVEELTKVKGKKTLNTADKNEIGLSASIIVRKMEREFPTMAFTAQLEREKKSILKNQENIVSFLNRHEDFDLAKHNIDLFLKDKKVAKKESEAIKEELKSVQRVFKLVPHYGKTNALRNENIHSAQGIVAMGETRFVKEMAPKAGLEVKEAKGIFRKAESINTAAMLIVGELQDTMRGMDIASLETSSMAKKLSAVSKDFPNLKTLFKLTDVCACEHCRSVYSPAAYLVEILQFLDKRSVTDLTTGTTWNSAKLRLFDRRPDLGEIDLSCENANTPVKYIDLVCELLEEAIIPDEGIDFTGVLSTGSDPLKGLISPALLAVLQTAGIPVTDQAMIFHSEIITGSSTPLPHYLRDNKAVCKIENTGINTNKVFRLRQTLSSAEELAVAPEYVNQEVYKLLSNELALTIPDSSKRCDFAFKLPFDLNHVEANAYFDRFGINRADLMKTFQIANIPAEESIAAELLGLTDAERKLIVSNTDTGNQQIIWNTISATASDELKVVDIFLTKTGISYKELDLLLKLKFIDLSDNLYIKHLDLTCDTANKEIANLNDTALDRIHRFLRLQKKTGWKFEFLDGIISQAGLGFGTLEDACLIKAAYLKKLSEETGIKLDELIGFYGEIPYQILQEDAPKPLYHQVFLNKAKNGFIDEGLLPEHIDVTNFLAGLETSIAVCLQLKQQDLEKLIAILPNNNLTFSNLSYLFAASRLIKKLKLKTDDFIILKELAGQNVLQYPFQNPKETLDFVKIVQDFKKSPINAAEVKYMLRHEAVSLPDIDIKIKLILVKLQKDYQTNYTLNKSKFDENLSADEQKATLQNELSKLSGIGEEDVKTFIKIIGRDWTLASDAKDIVTNKLNTLFTPVQITAINDKMDVLEGTILPNFITEREDLVDTFINTIDPSVILTALSFNEKKSILQSQLSGLGVLNDDDIFSVINFIEFKRISVIDAKQFADERLVFDTAEIKSKIDNLWVAVNAIKITEQKNLLKAFLDSLAAYQLETGKHTILEQTISTSYKVDLEFVKVVLKYARLKQHTALIKPLLSELLQSDSLIDTDLTHALPVLPTISDTVPFKDQYASIRLLNKLLPLVNAFKLSNDEVKWHFENNQTLDWFEWDSVPYSISQVPADFAKYLAFAGMLDLGKKYNAVPNPADAENPISFTSLADLLVAGASRFDFLEKLALLSGFENPDLDAVDAHLFPTWDLNNFLDIANWKKVEACLELLRQLSSTVPSIINFIQPNLTDEDVKTLRSTLKSRYDEETWLSTLKEIMDAIRPQKRNALVAYLLATNPEMKDENDLFDYFLVDVEMESCMPSSRIVQAHGTIQLFVQRCLMGLEPKAAADLDNDTNWNQWKWMKNYRVWEANRKVFLYPENWIEADLRDDKSFLFTELENELQQNELTDITAEEALIKYMEKLDNIAFLEVMATWYQTDIKTMHVFARTKGGDPAIYYYRRFEQERYWTPWEKVELDITGDHLLAFVRNNRLSLVWPVFSEVPDPVQESTIPKNTSGTVVKNEKPKRKLKIQLAVSEFANKKWQPKKISSDGIMTPDDFTIEEELLRRDKYNLRYLEATEQVWLFYTDMMFSKNMSRNNERNLTEHHQVSGIFNLTGCKGYPELSPEVNPTLNDFLPDFKDSHLKSQRYNELNFISPDDLSVKNGVSFFNFIELLKTTPGNFRLTYPHQFTSIDALSLIYQFLVSCLSGGRITYKVPLGTMLPYFMEDSNHAYVLLPGFYQEVKVEEEQILIKRTGSDVLQLIEDILALHSRFINHYEKNVDKFIKDSEFLRIVEEMGVYTKMKYGEQFKNMYHPLVCALRTTLYKNGIPELMKRETQLQKTQFDFKAHYNPNPVRVPQTLIADENGIKTFTYPIEDLDFNSDGSYSAYNWELFFHVPFLLATRLTKNQRFEEAMTWFHYMFNPTGALKGNTPQKYWVTKPFYLNQGTDYIAQRIDILLYKIADPSTPEIKELEFAIDQWRSKPFKPHVVARFRPVAYQKAVLMKYIDNLTEWGDYLFRQDTMESIAQATQMYILADKLLGPKPRTIPPLIKPPFETYNQIESKLDAFGNALIDLENIIPDLSTLPEGGDELPPPPVTLSMLYFCIPQNEKMLEYWDRIADRLFKIRHCQNIEGVERSLALFAPPIDPGMLVRAEASGLDISSVLAGINAPTPYYRFNVLSQKATELAQEVRGLGSSLLQALEKKDAEAMSLLRSEMEMKVLNAVKDMKLLQIKESKEQIEILKRTKKVTEERYNYYSAIEKITSKEQLNLDKLEESHKYQSAAQITQTLAGIMGLIPDLVAGASGFGGSPYATVKWGGANLLASAKSAADVLNILSSVASYEASRASIVGGYERRFDDWKLQERLANLELNSIEKQITAAEIRKEIAETDLRNHDLQIDNAKKTDEFMRSKFTNKELYDWMIGQISSVYFSAYQLSHDFAKKAERSYRFELGNDDTFISYGYWDSMKKGLQSADHLIHDIKRMETSYLDKNKREYELTKHVSITMLDPLALVRLRATGVCDFDIPEALFDMDHAGHYFRRIKSVSISLPCIAGPYTSVSAKLSLVKNKYRKNVNPDNSAATGYLEDQSNDERFIYNIGAIQSIAASNSQNDSGVFELNFRDERYLPFEGTGAISSWRLELPKRELSQFNYDTIADVIVHLKYTAREGGSLLRTAAEVALITQLNGIKQQLTETGLHVAINLKHDMPNEWYLLKQNNSVDLKIEKSRLPYIAQMLNANIESMTFIAKILHSPAPVIINSNTNDQINLSQISGWGELWKGQQSTNTIDIDTPFNLSINSADLEELMLIVKYNF